MKYRTLGRTGLEVSVLGFGGSSLGSVFEEIDEAEGVRAVHAAIDSGINLIDTAPYYGLGRAEEVLGRALRQMPRSKYLLATKVGRYGADIEDFDFSAARTLQSIEESLERLGVEHIDFLQVHDIEFGDIEQIINETLPALREAQAAGKARFVGITGLHVPLFERVLERAEVDTVQSYCHYCLHDTALADALPYLQQKGLAIFSSAPLAMRLLSDEGPPSWHPAPAALQEKCAQAATLCRERGSDISKLALQFAVANPQIPCTIVGAATTQRVLQNIRDIEEPLDEELLADVLQVLAPVHNTTWTSGRPENNPQPL
jgi:L-galactose dehydrogenase